MEQVKIFRWIKPYSDGSVGAADGMNEQSWDEFQRWVNGWLAEQRPQIVRTVHTDRDDGHAVAIYYRVDDPVAAGEPKQG